MRAIRVARRLSVFLPVLAGLVFAASAPIPSTALGKNRLVTVDGGHPYPVSTGIGVGGGFSSTVTANSKVYNTTFWCVDSQLGVNWNLNTYRANVVSMSNLNKTGWQNTTHYEDAAGSQWLYQFSSSGSPCSGGLCNNANARFAMAAWLVSQYKQFPNGPTPDGDAKNKAIQIAIWRLMENTVGTALPTSEHNYLLSSNISNGVSGYSDWIAAAAANYKSVDLAKWAIVSGGLQTNGALYPETSSYAHQTFLVQVVPEPGFYGVLGVGLLALVGFRLRRDKANSNPAS